MASIFTNNIIEENKESVDMELVEMFIYDDISRGSSEQIKNFCESSKAKALYEKGVLKKPTMMRLSASDDLKRRAKIAVFKLARDAKDPLWDKLTAVRAKEKELIEKLVTKYGNKGAKVSKAAQREYINVAKKL